MAVQTAAVTINKFVAGFMSDASPLTFPENTSAVDINMELNTDGSRQRSLGIDYEDNYQEISTSIVNSTTQNTAFNFYKWENVAGDAEMTIICVQIGNEIKFFDGDAVPLSSGIITTTSFPAIERTRRFSFSSVDGNIIIATGTNTVTVGVYSAGSITFTSSSIKVRDFFGVEDRQGGEDLTVGSGVQVRPISGTSAHIYNLRNQGFGIPRMADNSEIIEDPIATYTIFHNSIKGYQRFPSNSDSVTPFLFADPNDSGDRFSRRYFARDNIKNPVGTTRTAQGYYIIDLLSRGESRISENNKNNATYPEMFYPVSSLPQDRTPGGASVVGEFSGRVFYAGFSGDVVEGDEKSPSLASYIAFSQLVKEPSQIFRCYQEGDPTNDDSPDIVDTDGGYIRLNNSYGICSLINLGKNLMVVAANGVWRIFGGNDSGFSATNYVIEKITDKGARGDKSVVQIENTLVYWADDGIYWVKQNQYGDWSAENMTQNRIQKFFNEISIEEKKNCIGVYDSYQRKVRWLYNNSLVGIKQQKELVFDVNLGAFYERHISQLTNTIPVVLGGFNTNVFKATTQTELVTSQGIIVTSEGVNVTNTTQSRSSAASLYEVGYVVVTSLSPTITYTFASYSDSTFYDWRSVNGVGVDAPAVLITGTGDGGDAMRFKQIPYLYVHMRRTEDGFTGDYIPENQSSCQIQTMWDWTNSSNSNKWGLPFEAYRYRRVYFPPSINDPFDTGYELVVTKNKLRGRGRSIAMKFSSSPGKEMHIYGWSLVMTVNGNV